MTGVYLLFALTINNKQTKHTLMKPTSSIKILFVCHGNICRSPMAEFIFRRLVEQEGLASSIAVSSAATSDEEVGNPVYPLAKRKLAMQGIGCRDKTAQRITLDMYNESDYVIGMERVNIDNIKRLLKVGNDDKLSLLLDFLPKDHPQHSTDIADPWYTRDFEKAYNDIMLGCKALLSHIQKD